MINGTKDISGAHKYEIVTKSDSYRHYPPLKVLWLANSGDLHLRAPNSSTTVVFAGVPAGRFSGFMIEKIMNATTVAGDIVGGWEDL